MILQRHVVFEGVLTVAAVVCLYLLARMLVCRQHFVWKGRSLWLWLLPVFVCAGMLRATAVRTACEQEEALELDGRMVEMSGKVAEWKERDAWMVLVLEEVAAEKAYGGEWIGELGSVQVYLEKESGAEEELETKPESKSKSEAGRAEAPAPQIGDRIRLKGECAAFAAARNPGEFDYQLYYRSLKMSYRVFAQSYEVLGSERWRGRDRLRQFTVWACERLEKLVSAEDAGVFQAAVLGQSAGLSEQVRDLYQENGIAHLLAVSGLHLSLISLAIYGLLRKAGAGYGLAGLVGGGILFAYALITGASSSVLRAFTMVLCSFLAAYLGRSYDLISALSLSAVWMLWDSPYLISQAGVQLSFGAVLGIGGLSAWMGPGYGKNGFFVSLSLQMVTLPIILFHFFQYPLYGILLNLLVIPFMGVVIGTGMAGLLCSVWSLGAGQFAIGGGVAVLRWYELCCRFFGRLPGSSLILGRPEVWQIGVYYGLLTVLVLMIRWEREEAEKSGGKRKVFFLLTLMLSVLLVRFNGGLHLTLLDVGQGDCIVVSAKGGLNMMIDGGSSNVNNVGESRILPYLKSRGIRQLDYVWVSHSDADHISGILELLELQKEQNLQPQMLRMLRKRPASGSTVWIRRLCLPKLTEKDANYLRLEQMALEAGAELYHVQAGDSLDADDVDLQVLWPRDGGSGDANESAEVLLLEYQQFKGMFTGDIGAETERKLAQRLVDVDVLKVAHHGSRYSTGEAFLAAARPETAVISCSSTNTYGHPSPETVARLEDAGSHILCTKDSGAVTIRIGLNRMRILTFLTETTQPVSGTYRPQTVP